MLIVTHRKTSPNSYYSKGSTIWLVQFYVFLTLDLWKRYYALYHICYDATFLAPTVTQYGVAYVAPFIKQRRKIKIDLIEIDFLWWAI